MNLNEFYCSDKPCEVFVVPRARVELARLAALDFESSASTDSAIGAMVRKTRTEGGRIILDSPPADKSLHVDFSNAHSQRL